eukprot:10480451-Alexandrium_andersonii.AAC.1
MQLHPSVPSSWQLDAASRALPCSGSGSPCCCTSGGSCSVSERGFPHVPADAFGYLCGVDAMAARA